MTTLKTLYTYPTSQSGLLPLRAWINDDGVYCEDWAIHEDGLQGEVRTIMDGPQEMLSGSGEELHSAYEALIDYFEDGPTVSPLEECYRNLKKFSRRWKWEKCDIDIPPFKMKQYPGTTRRPFAVWLLEQLLAILESEAHTYDQPRMPLAHDEPLNDEGVCDELVIFDVKAMIAQHKAGTYGYTSAEQQAFWGERSDHQKSYDQAWKRDRGIAYPPARF